MARGHFALEADVRKGVAHHQRRVHRAHAAGRSAGEHQPDAEPVVQPGPDRPAHAKQHQQQVADHDRRQHQRQMHEDIDQHLAAKLKTRQTIGGHKRKRQAGQAGNGRDFQRQANGLHVFGTEGQAEIFIKAYGGWNTWDIVEKDVI